MLPSHEHAPPWSLRQVNADGALHIRLRFARRRLPQLEIESELDFANANQTCGWWWCLHPDPSDVSWADIERAVRSLGTFDPCSWRAAELMNGHYVREQWREESKDLNALHNALARLRPTSRIKNVHARFLAETTRLLRVASAVRDSRPGPGRHRNLVDRGTLDECAAAGLNHQAVAALLLLFGAERSKLSGIEKRLGELCPPRKLLALD